MELTPKEAIMVIRNLQDWLYFSSMNGGTKIQREAMDVAEKALDEYEYKGKTIRQWIEIIYNAEHGTNLAEVGRDLAEVGTDCSEFPNNSDVVDRQKAKNAICNACGKIDCDEMDTCEKLDIPSEGSKLLQPWEVLVAQAVLPQPEIIRCKDCKYAEYIDDVQTLWCTECGQGRTVAPNDFCSYAERREVTNGN